MAVKRLAAKGFASKKLTLKLTASRILSNKKPSYVAAVAAAVSAAAVSADPYFRYTSLLLTGTGNNNATNNTFLDSSTNNFNITRNGNTTQGTFTPYGSNWSNYFDGTGDYLTQSGTGGQYAFGTGAFTVEFWIYTFSVTARQGLYTNNTSSLGTGPVFAIRGSGTTGCLGVGSVGNADNVQTADNVIAANVWYHVALVREGTGTNQTKIYVNGVQRAVGTLSDNYSVSRECSIGSTIHYGENFNGYISNARIVKGTAVYTAAFTPSTTPLTAIANTSLLTCADNRFIDDSTNNFAITKNGDVSVQRFSPFSSSAPYSLSTIGGSGYFDGTGDYLSLTGSGLGSGNFTIELWGYFISYPNAQNALYNHGAADGISSCILYLTSSGTLSLYNYNSAVGTSTTNVPLNTWTHMAVTRVGTTLTYYINGVASGTGTSAANISETTVKVMQGFGGITNSPIGYVSNLRTVVGTAVYTANFTPPTAPVTAITNTSLLLNFTNAGIYDNAMLNNVETIGDAKISTTQSKYSGSSMYFDGTGDYLSIPNNTALNLSSGNFTIEAWVYWTGANNNGTILDKDGTFGVSYPSWLVGFEGTSKMRLFVGSGNGITQAQSVAATSTFPTNQWVHVAAVKNGTTLTLYQNGVSVASATQSATIIDGGKKLTVGYQLGQPTAMYWDGYIDDLRITKGVARYTSTFTPPTAALPTINSTTPTPTVEYLVVAGGGGGSGVPNHGGGGGAGGYRTATELSVSAGSSITVTVGAGGSGYQTPSAAGVGSNSVFGAITSAGGGAGGNAEEPGYAGGSGGGAGVRNATGGTATPAGQGNSGGGGAPTETHSPFFGSGGGGGAGAVGGTGTGSSGGGVGGAGLQSSITGTATYYAGGGGGSSYSTNGAAGGIGGGGAGAYGPGSGNGTANTGGGGGGRDSRGSQNLGAGNGGSGIVVIRYSDAYSLATATTGSPTLTIANGYIIYQFTSSDTITF